MKDRERIEQIVADLSPELIKLAKDIHANPEVGMEEFKAKNQSHCIDNAGNRSARGARGGEVCRNRRNAAGYGIDVEDHAGTDCPHQCGRPCRNR